MLLKDREWKLKYTPDDGDLVGSLYVPLLQAATRYDRLTGYFRASALALAARGVEWMVANGGEVRLLVGCTLAPEEVAAIEKGEALKQAVEAHILANPLQSQQKGVVEALELLAWMVANGRMEVRVAVPCDANRNPISAEGIFHEKSGIIEDKAGFRVAFNGSLNETEAGWTKNWESLNVFTSWRDPERTDEEDANFARLWNNKAKHAITLDVPSAVRDDLMRFLPKDDKPARLVKVVESQPDDKEGPVIPPPVPPTDPIDLRKTVWDFIAQAPLMHGGGSRVGEATSAVKPWPHQVRAFERLYTGWTLPQPKPPKLLIADEVGLGKTIQAGLLLRQAWLARKAKRILILAPKNVCRQWQIELREKFNLNWPIYDGQRLKWYASPAMRGHDEKVVSRQHWHHEPVVIVSSHLVRRSDRQKELLEDAEPWDLVVLDEAHHARRKGAGTANEGGPNALLALMRRLKDRTQGLVLLTATPMQVHPVEVYDLLALLGLPPEWSQPEFLRFFEEIERDNPSHAAFDQLAAMFTAVERYYGEIKPSELERVGVKSNIKARKILSALRDKSSIPRRSLETSERKAALNLMRLNTPISRLISRHTRELLRKYHKAGKLSTRIAERKVEDKFIDLSPDERVLYEAVENYIATTYNQADAKEKNAVGFVMTIYRRRLASSFFALANTLQARLDAINLGEGQRELDLLADGVDDDEDAPDADGDAELQRIALTKEERIDVEALLAAIRRLPPDTKLTRLREIITSVRDDGYQQVMVFTQFTDTMDFIRRELARDSGLRLMCFSGRGGEVRSLDGNWQTISRDEVKRRFREGLADVLLCTDAAAEGLNFQFCGSLINYDMPWNPMRVEQRIGRIDRLGQKHEAIRIYNLHYADTVETDVYRALRNRINLFESVVGKLQPILARLPSLITTRVLAGRGRDYEERAEAVREIEAQAATVETSGFDLDAVTEADLVEPKRPLSPVELKDLEEILARPDLLPPGDDASHLGARDFKFSQPGLSQPIRVTADPTFYEENADSVEFWTPGNPLFKATMSVDGDPTEASSLREILST